MWEVTLIDSKTGLEIGTFDWDHIPSVGEETGDGDRVIAIETLDEGSKTAEVVVEF